MCFISCQTGLLQFFAKLFENTAATTTSFLVKIMSHRTFKKTRIIFALYLKRYDEGLPETSLVYKFTEHKQRASVTELHSFLTIVSIYESRLIHSIYKNFRLASLLLSWFYLYSLMHAMVLLCLTMHTKKMRFRPKKIRADIQNEYHQHVGWRDWKTSSV